jgi:hypothetical protein
VDGIVSADEIKPFAPGNFEALQARFEAASPDDRVVIAKQARIDIMTILAACTCMLPFYVQGIAYNGHTPDCDAIPVMERIRARGGFT